MKFRDEKITDVMVINASTEKELCVYIRDIAEKYRLVDLQYSVVVNDANHTLFYSALALVCKEE
ncbi:MAG: hypothetical protein ACTSPD_10390 [Promethearchaeota archaeon]